MTDRFAIGTRMAHEWTVREADTVRSRGTVDFAVLATPSLIFMLEDTCVFAVSGLLKAGEATVGTSVHVDHLAATAVGERVRVECDLVSVRGRRLVFRVQARCGSLLIARGLHERALVNAEHFTAGTAAQAAAPPLTR